MTEAAPEVYPLCPLDRLDAYPAYDRLRESDPLPRVKMPYGEPTWLATRHADVRAFLLDATFSRKTAIGRDAPGFSPNGFGHSIPFMDQPEHSEARKLLARGLSKKRIDALRPRIQEITDGLIDGMVAHGAPADLVESFARQLPLRVNCELYGVPEADRDQFQAWSRGLMAAAGRNPEEMMADAMGLMGYINKLISERRKEPGDDLITALVQGWDGQDMFTEQDLTYAVLTLLLGGLDPVAAHVANSMYVLLDNPDRYALLHQRPEIIPAAVEELLRFVSIGDVFGFGSYATRDLRLAGKTVHQDEPVLALLASANRDPEVFSDPNTLDLTRPVNPHVGFGHGPHYCAGAGLARIELQIAYGTLARRLPGLRLAEGDRTDWWSDVVTVVRTLRRLPVEW
jgi:cytochrome P450